MVRGCDHGVSLGVEPKLRTVLWGWAGEPVPDTDLARLETLLDALGQGLADELATLLTRAEVRALRLRTESLLRSPPAPGAAARAGRRSRGRRCSRRHVVLPGEVVARSVRPRRARPR